MLLCQRASISKAKSGPNLETPQNTTLRANSAFQVLESKKADKREKNAESSPEFLEKTLGKPLPNHEVHVIFSVLFCYGLLPVLTKGSMLFFPPSTVGPGWHPFLFRKGHLHATARAGHAIWQYWGHL